MESCLPERMVTDWRITIALVRTTSAPGKPHGAAAAPFRGVAGGRIAGNAGSAGCVGDHSAAGVDDAEDLGAE
jgi:hypothetical protein